MTELCNIVISYRLIIAGSLIMAAISAYLAGLNSRRNRFAAAAAKFHSVILKELEGLYPIPFNWTKGISSIDKVLRDKFTNIQSAVLEFRPYISWFKRKRFNQAWLCYYNPHQDKNYQNYGHYMPIENNPDYKENFQHNVDSLLEFAKQP